MKKIFLSMFLCLLFLFVSQAAAADFDLYTYFPNLALGPDPNGPDSIYVVCAGITSTTLTLQVYLGTDNSGPDDSLVAFFIPLEISVDKPGVTLDTTESTIYAGTILAAPAYRAVNVVTGGGPPNGDPSIFPMQLLVGGILGQSGVGPGDHLLANLKFNVSEPTNICVTGTFLFQGNGLMVVTEVANGYVPGFKPECCGPIVPTLTEWGLIIFGVLLLGGLIWYLRRRRATRLA